MDMDVPHKVPCMGEFTHCIINNEITMLSIYIYTYIY